MWRMLPGLLLFVAGPFPDPGPAPPPDARVETHRPDIVWIPGGWFLRGSDEQDILHAVELCRAGAGDASFGCRPEMFIDEAPKERVWVSAYGIDRTEVTVAAFHRCVASNTCPPSRLNQGSDEAAQRLARPSQPIAGVTWDEARSYCAWVGGRLPTEAEWERAARGHDGRRFPWGDYLNPRLANHGRPLPGVMMLGGQPDDTDGYRWSADVGSFPGAVSPFGLLDMAGNVWEWTADLYDPEAYVDTTRIDPVVTEGAGGFRVRRGGSWSEASYTMRVAHRSGVPESQAFADLGFRCAYDRSARRSTPAE